MRDYLIVFDGVAMSMDLVVVDLVISNLHSARQDTHRMCARANSVVYRPEITKAKFQCKALHQVFANFDRPTNLSIDGGPEFTAAKTTGFLKNGVSLIHCLQSTSHILMGVQKLLYALQKGFWRNILNQMVI